MEVDEGDKPDKAPFRQADFIWSLQRAQELLAEIMEAEAQKRPYLVDLKIQTQVKEKVHTIEALKSKVKEVLEMS